MADAKPADKTQSNARALNMPALVPNPIVEHGKPVQTGSKIVVTNKMANGDLIRTRMDVDPKYLREKRGRGNGG